MLYWRAAFEELTEKQKNKYNKKYEDELNKYFKKMKYFKKLFLTCLKDLLMDLYSIIKIMLMK
jgi:hypothetical protein